MKKNDYLLLSATAAYSFLFYRQNAGINFFLFTIIFMLILAFRNKELLNSRKWWWSAVLCIVSSACVFIHSSALSIVANILSLILLAGISFNTATSALFAFAFSSFSIVSSPIFMVIDAVKRSSTKPGEEVSRQSYKAFAFIFVSVLSLLFFAMYKSANPLFAENTKWINLDFLSFQWIAFTIGGFILVYGTFYHRFASFIIDWENGLNLHTLAPSNLSLIKKWEAERFAGVLLFLFLNLMLLVLNIGDIQTLYFLGALPKNVSHSDFVHNGVGVTIFSIIIATSLIMFLFRNDFSFVKHNTLFKVMAYLWIVQNILMLSSTMIRNQMYIHSFDLTYRRIGVYVWLILAVIGLIVMFIKLRYERSNWFLIKINVAVWFTMLTLSASFNWDKMITNYNLKNKSIHQIDFSYLLSLSEANIPELKNFSESIAFKKLYEQQGRILKSYQEGQKKLNASNNYSSVRLEGLQKQINLNHNLFIDGRNFHDLLSDKIHAYISNYSSDWRSYDMRDQQIISSIYH